MSEEEKLLIEIKELQLKNDNMSTSLEKQKKDFKALDEAFSFFSENFEARITFLAGAIGKFDDLDDGGSSDNHP